MMTSSGHTELKKLRKIEELCSNKVLQGGEEQEEWSGIDHR